MRGHHCSKMPLNLQVLADNILNAKIFGFVLKNVFLKTSFFTCMDHVHKVSDGDEAEGRADWRVG